MSVYVDRLPKSCYECVCNDDGWKCGINREDISHNGRRKDCPLKVIVRLESDLISRQAAIDAVTKYFIDEYDKMPYEYDEEVKDNVFTDMKWVDISLEHNKEIRKVLKSLPPVEPKPVCEDCISRADTIKAMCSKCVINRECIGECSDVVAIKNMPPVEPKRPKGTENPLGILHPNFSYDVGYEQGRKDCGRPKGEWKLVDHLWECDCCQYRQNKSKPTNFCPNCGADMRGDKE